MTPLADLRLDPRDESELTWYFGDAQGELGLRAINYEPTIGSQDGHDAAHERQMLAAERHRRIGKTLDRCPRWAVRVLQRWVTSEGRFAPELRVALGRYAGLASLTELGSTLGLDGVRHLCRHGTGGKADDIVRHWFAVLEGQTRALLRRAVYEFGQAKPRRRAG